MMPVMTTTILRSQPLLNRSLPLAATIASFLACGTMVTLGDDAKVPKWQENVTKAEIPEGPAKGMAHGKAFKVERATISDFGILSIRMGKEFFADAEFLIFTFVHDKEKIEGKSFKIEPGEDFGTPHIHFRYMVGDEKTPETEIFMNKYSMVLEFGKAGKDGIPGKIYLSLPDKEKSFVAGTFTAERK
jgi:hypothetical protein